MTIVKVYFVNRCDTEVSILYRTDRGYCAAGAKRKYPCRAMLIAPHTPHHTALGVGAGRFYWIECAGRRSPVEAPLGTVRCR